MNSIYLEDIFESFDNCLENLSTHVLSNDDQDSLCRLLFNQLMNENNAIKEEDFNKYKPQLNKIIKQIN